jgi:hypothetical protein
VCRLAKFRGTQGQLWEQHQVVLSWGRAASTLDRVSLYSKIASGQVVYSPAASSLKEEFQAALRQVLEYDLPEARKSSVLTESQILVEESCEWIKARKEVRAWEDDPGNQLLWLCGSPGKGKTSLALYLTGELEKNWRQNATDGRVLHIVLYYFFRRGSKTVHALGSL